MPSNFIKIEIIALNVLFLLELILWVFEGHLEHLHFEPMVFETSVISVSVSMVLLIQLELHVWNALVEKLLFEMYSWRNFE